MKAVKAFGRFWYEFIVGDDWKIAVSVVLALVLVAFATAGGWFSDAGLAVFGGALIVVGFVVTLFIDVHGKE